MDFINEVTNFVQRIYFTVGSQEKIMSCYLHNYVRNNVLNITQASLVDKRRKSETKR